MTPEALGAEDAHLAFLLRGAPADGRGTRGGGVMRRAIVALLGLHLRIELVHALGVARQRRAGHRTVHEHRQDRDPLLRLEPLQPVDQLLDAPDGEGRDDQLAAACSRSR